MDPAERKKIAAIERNLLEERPWQLRGEISAHSRPVNSLLFEDVSFEQSIKAPKITPETTESLEALIRQRIKDGRFDDPVRKTKPTSETSQSIGSVEVSSEKSKVGLAKLYEQELVAKVTSGTTKDGPEKEIELKLLALFRKLDSLTER